MLTRRRQRGLFTILILSSFLIYLNWLVNINEWSYASKKTNREIIASSLHKRSDPSFGEAKKPNGEANNVNFNFKNKIMLVAIKEEEVVAPKEEKVRQVVVDNAGEQLNARLDEKLTQLELSAIFNVLYLHRAFLVDVNLLKELQEAKHLTPGIISKVETFNVVKNVQEDSDASKTLLTFGIYAQSFEKLNQVRPDALIFFNFELVSEYLICNSNLRVSLTLWRLNVN